ncbi:hypothetical protein CAPTEDRAFT_149755 [Capitella teleta]|uniref:ATP-binding cassette sub-family B member 10, mitochondrial n=1 Tax=Capitella teleta TaxID=283909 RepID=R7UCX4_CAPTE|nr:hypothetical protein CAPTEDRAFT_149755 [Capitella teleta]|eukprot:ELU04240.1 hypothetical protein CAPTEDRAFT_149755 [Capitella teleta]
MGLLLISSGVTMVVPFGIGRVIDIIYTKDENSKMISKLTKFCILLLGVFLVGAAANFGRIYIMQTSGNKIIKRMREKVFGSIIRQDIAFFDKNKTGELINRLSTDTSIVGASITNNISDGMRSVTQAAGGIGMMVYMSPKLTMVAMCIVPPVFILSRYYGRYLQKITKNVQDSLADATQVAEERLANMRTVRAFVQEKKEKAAYENKINDVLSLSQKEALARSIFWSSTGLSGNIMIISVFYYGGLLMNEAQITVGELSSFMLYAAFAGVSIGGLTTFYSELMRGIGASKRLWQLVDTQPKIPYEGGLVPTLPLKGQVQFNGLTFSYPSRLDDPIIQDLDLTIPQGTMMAVVGGSGSGKSTLVSLLLRYYDPQSGSINVDGMNIQDLDPQWLRSHMGIVSQEPALFSCSIAENIAYGAIDPSTVTTDQIMEAARMANALQFVEKFPSGFDTMVGERGVMLSGGQKQRIAIARAIIKNPAILLFDEATSALDAESEFLVKEALDRVTVGRTVITIAHRLSTIKNADQIAVLSEGRVSEIGTYEQLMAIPQGTFRKLVEKQTIDAF